VCSSDLYATLCVVRRDHFSFPTLRRAGATLLAGALAWPASSAAADFVPVPNAPLLSMVSLWIVTTTVLLVVGCVLLHYETLRLLSYMLLRFHGKRRRRILLLVLALVGLATLEIWLFGLGYYWLLSNPGYGALHGPGRIDEFLDYVYFSAVIHTTLGLGDLVPSGSIRFLVGTQALVGFTLISWSAAFTFLEMERFWRDSTERRHRAAYGPGYDKNDGG
jgi:hypothetical protein